MKRLLLVLACTLSPLALFAADTAYTALRIVGKRNGDAALNQVVEVRGRFGAPEPATWTVVLAEPSSRGSVREYEVKGGRISGERSPNARVAGAPLDLNKLNIDSEGAFTIVNKEAQKANIPFDRVDYVLNNSGRSSAPVWHVELLEGRNGRVGTMEIAADSGDILNRQLTPSRRSTTQEDRTYLRDHPAGEERRRDVVVDERRRRDVDADRYEDEDRVYEDDRRVADGGRRVYVEEDEDVEGPGITDVFGKIGRHFEKRGRQIRNFFGR